MRGRLKRIAQTTAALTPLVLGVASPAHGCLVGPIPQQADESSDQISTGPVGTGPNAPFDELQAADERNANDKGFSCDPMCIAGNWENTPAADK